MRLPTCIDAGSMPAEALARGTVPFDEEFLEGADFSDFQREVATRLLRVVQALLPESLILRTVGSRIRMLGRSLLIINFVPRRDEAAEMTIYIEPDEFVDVGAGRHTTFGLPHEVWDPRAKDILRFTEQIVSAIIDGKLRETLYCRGNVPVRCKSELDVEGAPVSIDRMLVSAWLRQVFRKRSVREVTYPPYGSRTPPEERQNE